MAFHAKTGVASPIGVITPDNIGQHFIDTAAPALYQAVGLTSADWVALTSLSSEEVQDIIGAVLVDTATLNLTYDDVGNAIYGDVLNSPLLGSQDSSYHLARANHTGSQLAATISDFSEAVDDRAATLIQNGTGITWTYDDAGNTLTPAVTITQYTDEMAQDAIGAALVDTATIDLTYNDAANQISAGVIPAGVDHNSLANFVANKHIDHSAVSITAGTGLTGGGDLTVSRSMAVVANSTVQQVEVAKNSGAVVGTRKQLNFIEGANVVLTVADDAANDQIDITVAASGGGGITAQEAILYAMLF